jgi:hypothetical protein
VEGQMATRRLRIVKYRGSIHGTSEYPFLIDEGGISILPVTSMGLKHEASVERVSSGIQRLDVMMGGKGYFRGSSVLVSGALMRPPSGASGACGSPSRNRPARSCAICAPSASISSRR